MRGKRILFFDPDPRARRVAERALAATLFCAPGNAGIESIATCVPIKADDIAALKNFVLTEQIDFTVIGPEAPLALGIVDEFRRAKLKIFGPTKSAARLEASKILLKRCDGASQDSNCAGQKFRQGDRGARLS